MKILFLAPHPFFAERGTPIAVRLAVESLCRAGHRVDLLTYHEGTDISVPGLRLNRIARPPGISNVPIGFSAKKLVCDLWLMVAAMRLVRRGGYDVVHAGEEAVFIGLLCRLLGRFKLVYDMDSLMADQIAEKWPGIGPLLPVLYWCERQAIQRSDLVLAVCRHIADRAALETDPARVHLTPDVAFTSEAAAQRHEALRPYCAVPAPIALYVGNLERYQGIDLLLEAMAVLPPARRCNLLAIGGTAGMIEHYQTLAGTLGLERHVRFLGKRPLDSLADYLAQADILCSPRLKGVNTPMKIYSYMAAGKAILATGIASHDQVLDAGCAMLVDATPAAMAAGLDRLATDPDLRDRLGQAAAARAGTVYSSAAFDERLNRAYATLQPERIHEPT